MARVLPAMKGKMGDIDYYVISMKAGAVISTLKVPKSMSDWENLTIDERYQRDIKYKRVKDHIAPYLVNNPSRFFGSLIVTVINSNKSLDFQSLQMDALADNMLSAYRSAASNIGFLTLHDEEIIVPLDGQHRLKGLEFAITGRDNQGNEIPGIDACKELASEDIVLIMIDPIEDVEENTARIRRIFTHVNLTARKPTTGENIVTNDDNIVAVLARKIASEEIEEGVMIGADLVKYKSNTLTSRDPHFTTLAIIYNINQEIIESYCDTPLVTTELPTRETANEYEQECRKIWAFLLKNVVVFREMLQDLESTGNQRRVDTRKENLLGKPVGQECLFRVFLQLTGKTIGLSWEEAVEHLNKLPWLITDDNISRYWENVLWAGTAESGKINTKNRNLAVALMVYLAGGPMSKKDREAYAALFPSEDRPLPAPVIQ